MKQGKIIIFLIFLCIFVFSFQKILAQTLADINANDITISTNPEIPKANENLTISLSSFLLNLDNARIEWKVDGESRRSGVGVKEISITAGALGSRQTVSAVIVDINTNSRFEKNLIIEPSSLDLLWEVKDGYVHPFYKGKVLPVRESLIEITAVPNRKSQTTTAQKSLIYTWKRDFDIIQDASGFSKQSFSFRNDVLKNNEDISVNAREGSSSYNSSSELAMVFYNPIILFYQKKDGVGVDFWNALNDGAVIGTNDFDLIAEPFFISPKEKNDPLLKYTWKVNGTNIGTPEYKSYLRIRGDGGSGRSAVQLDIENLNRIFQRTSRVLQVNVLGN